jgi:antitoxin component YwqK of YwqJK toxin-antitoxin module
MRVLLIIITLSALLFGCESPIIEKVDSKHPNGEKKKVSFYQEIESKEVLVEEKYYHDNGKFKMGGKFKDELREGEWNAYFENEQLQSEGFFKAGKRFGIAKVYFPNGKLRYEGQYENDKEVGHWKFYNESGKLVDEKDF